MSPDHPIQKPCGQWEHSSPEHRPRGDEHGGGHDRGDTEQHVLDGIGRPDTRIHQDQDHGKQHHPGPGAEVATVDRDRAHQHQLKPETVSNASRAQVHQQRLDDKNHGSGGEQSRVRHQKVTPPPLPMIPATVPGPPPAAPPARPSTSQQADTGALPSTAVWQVRRAWRTDQTTGCSSERAPAARKPSARAARRSCPERTVVWSLLADLAVDRFAQEVGVPSVTGSFLDEVQ